MKLPPNYGPPVGSQHRRRGYEGAGRLPAIVEAGSDRRQV